MGVTSFMWSLKDSITVSTVTTGPWMGTVTCTVPVDLYSLSRSAILVMKRDFPIPDRVELTTRTQELGDKIITCMLTVQQSNVDLLILAKYMVYMRRHVHSLTKHTYPSESTMEACIPCVAYPDWRGVVPVKWIFKYS